MPLTTLSPNMRIMCGLDSKLGLISFYIPYGKISFERTFWNLWRVAGLSYGLSGFITKFRGLAFVRKQRL